MLETTAQEHRSVADELGTDSASIWLTVAAKIVVVEVVAVVINYFVVYADAVLVVAAAITLA